MSSTHPRIRRIVAIAGAAMAIVQAREALAQMSTPLGSPGMSDQKKKDDTDQLPEIDPKIGATVDSTFDHAEKAFERKEWLEAIAYYQHVRAKFSYNIRLAALAQLRLGDIAFEREKWLEAKEYYKEFLRMHPNHEKADYASFRVGLCAYKDIPGDIFFTPPSSERDQSEVRSARNAMADFVRSYGDSKYASQARDIVVACDNKLAEHEMYVATYYADRDKWAGTALRAEGLARNYPDSVRAPEALLLGIRAHVKLKKAAVEQEKAAEKKKDTAAIKEQQAEVDRQESAAQKDFDALEALHPAKGVLEKGRSLLAAR